MAFDPSDIGAALTSSASSALDAAKSPFYYNPQYITPTQIAALRQYGNALLKQPTSIHRPAQGFAMIANALIGGASLGQADKAEQGARQAGIDATTQSLAPVAPSAAPVADPTAPADPPPPVAASPMAYAPTDAGTPAPADGGTFNRMIGQESGGKQFDSDGNPLTSPKGAVGIAQIMPATGPEAAEAAGVPYDAKRLATDPAYNRQLGEAYYNKQLAKYGDPAVAAAAYNAGPGAVDNAMAKAQTKGGSYLDYLPAETQNYVGNVTGGAAPASKAIAAAAPQSSMPAGASAYAPGANPTGMLGQAPPNMVAGNTAATAAALNNPYVSDQAKALIGANANPQIIKDANGGQYYAPPGQRPRFIMPGAVQSTTGVAGASVPTLTQTGPGGAPGPSKMLIPGAQPGGGGVPKPGAGPLDALKPLATQANDITTTNAAHTAPALAAADQYAKERTATGAYNRTIQPLAQAIPALEALGKTGTGPGTDQRNQIVSFLQSAGIPGFDASKVKNFDEAKKYLTDYVNQTGASGTNDKLAASFAGNPSVDISNAAAVDVAKTALALQRMQQAKVLAFQGKDPQGYADYAGNFATQQDPRAFGIDLMTPAARAKLAAEMPPGSPERAKFNASAKLAHDTGVIQPLRPPQAAQ